MAATVGRQEGQAGQGGGAHPAAVTGTSGSPGHRSTLRTDLLLALELAGLAAFAFSRPVLDSFGQSPETFTVNGASTADIVIFGLAVALIPAVLAVALGLGARAAARKVGRHLALRQLPLVAHVALVGLAVGVGAWRMGQDQTGWPGTATKLQLLGAVAFLVGAFLRWWGTTREVTATFLRYGSAAVVVFGATFFVGSPTSELVLGATTSVDAGMAAGVDGALGDDPPPVLFVVFDALPTMSLMDGEGGIDARTFPNFGALAGDATWYRNATTVAGFTALAVPALATGRYPEPRSARPDNDPENLFTLLGGSYDVRAEEQVTRLCPGDVCATGSSRGVGALLAEAADWWSDGARGAEDRAFGLAGAEPSRYENAEEWIEGLDLAPDGRPDLTFLHTVIPHEPWQFTDEGERYALPAERPPGTVFGRFWTDSGLAVAEQRHMLMARAADRLLGRLLDKLKDEGVYDETLVVVTADHGTSLTPETAQRYLEEGNQSDIAWVPLLIKRPGQTEERRQDGNVEAVDVMPTIVEELGVEIPWEVDGMPVTRAVRERDPERKLYVPHRTERRDTGLRSVDGLLQLDVQDSFQRVLDYRPRTGPGPDGVWRLTGHGDLVGREVADLPAATRAGELRVNWPGGYEDIDLADPLPLEVIGGTDVAEDELVAFALNGTIGAVGTVQSEEQPGGRLVHGLLPPRLFAAGDNDLTAHVVRGGPGDEVLHPLDVTFG